MAVTYSHSRIFRCLCDYQPNVNEFVDVDNEDYSLDCFLWRVREERHYYDENDSKKEFKLIRRVCDKCGDMEFVYYNTAEKDYNLSCSTVGKNGLTIHLNYRNI